MDIITTIVGVILFVAICATMIRVGNCVTELRKLNKKFDVFLDKFKV